VKSPVQDGDFTAFDDLRSSYKAFYAPKYNVFQGSARLSFSGIFIAE